jgi:hypothetical protein
VGDQDERNEAPYEERSTLTQGPPLRPEIARRVESMLDAVEGQLASVRREANDEARRRVQDARRLAEELVAERQRQVSDLTDGLIARAEALLERLEAGDPSGSLGPSRAAPNDPSVEREPSEQHGPGPDVARLVAIQMAASGSTRGQVERHIRNSLALREPDEILDEVFGPKTRGEDRAPWASRPRT